MSEKPTSVGSFLAGAAAATVVDGIIFPLDTIKTRSQAANGLLANGGYKGLYRGLGSVIVCTVPSASIFFFSYEEFKHLAITYGVHGWKGHLLASAAAEALSCAVLTPAEIVKQRAQVSKSTSGSRDILRALVKEGDWKGLGRGYVGLIARNVPVTAIQFMLYENFKDRYRASIPPADPRTSDGKDKTGIKLTAFESGACAGLSGSIAAGITTPMDVIKTRVMLQTSSTITQVTKRIIREDGVKGLFKGLALRMVWTSLGLSLYLGSYEAMKNYIDGP